MRNRMKEKLLQGKPVLGISMMIPAVQLVDMAGKLGFDWVLIDCEHGSISLETVELMAMAAEASHMTSIIRPPKNDPEIILRYMDRGVMGVQAPHVNNASEAQEIVAAVKYHPLGKRSLAVGTRSANYGFNLNLSEYAQQSNRETLVCIQIEDKDALGNIASIAAVAGIDVLFIGPSDLSQSLGYPGAADHPVVQKAMQEAFAAIINAGKAAGTAGNFATAATRLQQGVTYYYTHFPTLFAHGCSEFFRIANSVSVPEKPPHSLSN
ncbi:MAG TPA: aldolase/citrate lyase family protein [Methylomusa anaerophila]|uniref:4-hydroxy-2-oxo-heptane-1,7-dioate aldolase n=1 Tax=Methylomusa anaerophila TaxID=1930071 RepID=A0A348AGS1_9FIRM|nr:aldolase/citrate lyase family protein [Methylomusa anaerophila]BBB90269.1 4-hydroxy-2-oxo-heptane-1,7-dioate aldolase [Methylomusa anaerophila]HML89385.1 aldolase/citrate lyase family protein [Methylomusa anaerophila]